MIIMPALLLLIVVGITVTGEEETSEAKIQTSQFRPHADPEVIRQFLKGEYCLHGGSGWWKYEFCYGKKVDEYHEESSGRKTVINLGQFKEEDHLAWLEPI